jgi:hypothetical protein
MPTRLYVKLRKHALTMASAQHRAGQSLRIRAEMLGVSKTTYSRMEKFMTRHAREIEQAKASGDWSVIEDSLFNGHGDYRSRPSFRKARATITAFDASVTSGILAIKEPVTGVGPAAGPDAKSTGAIRAQIDRWIRVGMAAEGLFTPQGLELLLREHSETK